MLCSRSRPASARAGLDFQRDCLVTLEARIPDWGPEAPDVISLMRRAGLERPAMRATLAGSGRDSARPRAASQRLSGRKRWTSVEAERSGRAKSSGGASSARATLPPDFKLPEEFVRAVYEKP